MAGPCPPPTLAGGRQRRKMPGRATAADRTGLVRSGRQPPVRVPEQGTESGESCRAARVTGLPATPQPGAWTNPLRCHVLSRQLHSPPRLPFVLRNDGCRHDEEFTCVVAPFHGESEE